MPLDKQKLPSFIPTLFKAPWRCQSWRPYRFVKIRSSSLRFPKDVYTINREGIILHQATLAYAHTQTVVWRTFSWRRHEETDSHLANALSRPNTNTRSIEINNKTTRSQVFTRWQAKGPVPNTGERTLRHCLERRHCDGCGLYGYHPKLYTRNGVLLHEKYRFLF